MERLIINVPEKKSKLVKQLLMELGVTIDNKTKATLLAEEIDKSIKSGEKPSLDKIVAEVRESRSNQQ